MREFLAIPLPEEVRRAAAEAASALAGSDGWRAVAAAGLHVTIRFLGDVDPARHDALGESWRAAASGIGPVSLRLGGGRFFPSPARARVVGILVLDETPDRALTRLATRVEGAARAAGLTPELRPFAPHVTVARARGAVRVKAQIAGAAGDLPGFVADRLVLFSSQLTPGGARYAELDWYPFGPAPGP